MSISEEKREIRIRMLEMLEAEKHKAESEEICSLIMSLPSYEKAKTILAFNPFRKSEPDIRPVLKAASKRQDASVLVPEVISETEMAFIPYGHYAFTAGGINHLMKEQKAPGEMASPILVLVPGLAFTEDGIRLGRGGGYYDRYLALLSSSGVEFETLGVCFRSQILPSLPSLPTDFRVSSSTGALLKTAE